MTMSRRAFRVVQGCVLGLFAVSALALAADLPVRFEVVNPKGAPTRLAAKLGELLHTSDSLRLEFQLANRSQEFLPWVELTADIYSPTGELKGFHSFTLSTNLRSGEQRFFLYRTSEIDLSPGDRVVLTPTLVRMGTGNWSPRPDPQR